MIKGPVLPANHALLKGNKYGKKTSLEKSSDIPESYKAWNTYERNTGEEFTGAVSLN